MFQSLLLKILESHEQEIVALGLSYLAKLWTDNQPKMLASLQGAIKSTPLGATATDAEMGTVMTALTNWFSADEFKALETAILALVK